MKAHPPNPAPRTPEEYLDALDGRSRRRIAGGLLSLHGRGSAELGPAWNVALALCGGLATAIGWRWLTKPKPAPGEPELRVDRLFALCRGVLR